MTGFQHLRSRTPRLRPIWNPYPLFSKRQKKKKFSRMKPDSPFYSVYLDGSHGLKSQGVDVA